MALGGSHLGFGSYDSRSKLHFALGSGSVLGKSGSGAPALSKVERAGDALHGRQI